MTTTTTPKAPSANHALDREAIAALAALNEHLAELEAMRVKGQAERDAIVLRIANARQAYDTRAQERAEEDLAWFGHPDNERSEINLRETQKRNQLERKLTQAIEAFRQRLQVLAVKVADKKLESAIAFLLPSVGGDFESASALAETLPHVVANRERVSGLCRYPLEGEALLRALQKAHREIESELAKLS